MTPKQNIQTSLSELWFLSYPLIITMAAQVVMQFTDRMFLAWYSPEALGACVPGGMLAMMFGALFVGLSGYTGVFISQFNACKKRACVTLSLWQGILLALLCALVLVALTPAGRALIDAFGHAPEVRTLELTYFTILNLFSGIAILNNALSSFFSGRGKTKIPMYVALAGNAVNLGLDYVLIFGKLGLPALGIKGAAWATILGGVSMTVIYGMLLFTQKNRRAFKMVRLAGFYKPIFTRLVRFGLPNGFGILMDVISFTLFTFMVGNIDTVSLQASNIVMSMQPVVFMVILGLGTGIQILVSKYQGLNRPDQSVQVLKNACKLGYAYAGGIALLFFFGTPLFIHLFIPAGTVNGAEIAARTVPLIKLVSFFVLGDAAYLIFGAALRGAGDTKFFMRIMIGCAWLLLIPGTWLLVYRLHASITWVWGWLTFYAWITAVFMVWRFARGKWKNIRVTSA